jgi:MoaA/NifB/PqqE/SkfB family radical SAM enzyme
MLGLSELEYFRRLSTRQKIKAFKYIFQRYYGIPSYPLDLKVEYTRKCNSDCIMCVRTSLPQYPDLTVENFNTILEKFKGSVIFNPHGLGEALCNKDFMALTLLAKNYGMAIGLSTNGSLLDAKMSTEFFSTIKPLKLTFSVDAGEKEKYESIRRGLDFDVVCNNIKNAVAARNLYSKKSMIELYCTLGTYNSDQIEPVAALASRLGVDQLVFTDLAYHGVGVSKFNVAIRNNQTDVSKRIELIRLKYPKLSVVANVTKAMRCHLSTTQLFVDCNGDVFPCCLTMSYWLGNIFKQPFKEIWLGPKFNEFRKSFLTNPLKECAECVNYVR